MRDDDARVGQTAASSFRLFRADRSVRNAPWPSFRQALPGFALPSTPLDANDLQTAVTNFNALPQGEFGKDYRSSLQLANLSPTLTAIHQILAVAVAMRISGYNRSNIAAARRAFEGLRGRHRLSFPYAGREEMIDNLEALALTGWAKCNAQLDPGHRENHLLSVSGGWH